MDIAGCSLAELIDDPLTGLVMKSDGVDRHELKFLLAQVAQAIAGDPTRKPLSVSANRAMLTLSSMLTPPTHAASLSGPQKHDSCDQPKTASPRVKNAPPPDCGAFPPWWGPVVCSIRRRLIGMITTIV